ncbi:MAG: formylglycine-generating enzyme family protein, partial [Xenococcus sp. (in: cyanobacteria)]
VWEWCQDDFNENYGGAPIDGRAWILGSGSNKVLSGGSWNNVPGVCRSATRFNINPERSFDAFGFRVVCMVPRT